ncbi:MAG: outer membrane lipoprotein carrier protein LolA [Myxococcales bacterium]|nr:outer membrane lipoprotein carrier protein LolA [Myxococcales bacterium]MCB9708879.1 outer membrane lipoprotein carrier protein LolA [Myxococcales bacterium]
MKSRPFVLALAITWGFCLGVRTVSAEPATPRKVSAPHSQVAKVLERLSQITGLSAHFREEKHITLLSKPLISHGMIYYLSPDQLLRRTESPEKSAIRIRNNRVDIADAAGQSSIDLAQHSAIRELIVCFLYVLQGDSAALNRSYTLTFQRKTNDSWMLRLNPKTAALRQMIRYISLSGHDIILQKLIVAEASGDISVTTFEDVQTDRKFSPEERRRMFGL